MTLRIAYNKVLISTEALVKQYSKHLNLKEFKLKKNDTDLQIIDKLSKLSLFISKPYYSHIYLKNPKTHNP